MTGPKIYNKDFFAFDKDETLVSEYLTRIISTTQGEMVNNITFGSKVKSYIFNFSSLIKQDIERELNKIFDVYLEGYTMENFSLKEEDYSLIIELSIKKTVTQEVINYAQTFTLLEKIV